jgi:hypothetical protein
MYLAQDSLSLFVYMDVIGTLRNRVTFLELCQYKLHYNVVLCDETNAKKSLKLVTSVCVSNYLCDWTVYALWTNQTFSKFNYTY